MTLVLIAVLPFLGVVLSVGAIALLDRVARAGIRRDIR
jgi:hypothetical protein